MKAVVGKHKQVEHIKQLIGAMLSMIGKSHCTVGIGLVQVFWQMKAPN
jgi:hypothetical protein